VGWLLLGFALSLTASGVIASYTAYGHLARPGALPAAGGVARYYPATGPTALALLGLYLLSYHFISSTRDRWHHEQIDKWTEQVQADARISIAGDLTMARLIALVVVAAASTIGTLLVLALVLGVRIAAGPLGLLVILVAAALLTMSVTAAFSALAYAVPQHGTFFAIAGFVTLPLLFMSNAFVPLDAMPAWMAACSSASLVSARSAKKYGASTWS
jgi:hypothetical protein